MTQLWIKMSGVAYSVRSQIVLYSLAWQVISHKLGENLADTHGKVSLRLVRMC